MNFVRLTLISFVALLPFSMPRYYEHDQIENDQDMNTNRREIRLWKPLLIVTFFYYFFSCGIERIYQPMVSLNFHHMLTCNRVANLIFLHDKFVLFIRRTPTDSVDHWSFLLLRQLLRINLITEDLWRDELLQFSYQR